MDDPDAEDVEECDDEWEGSLENETFIPIAVAKEQEEGKKTCVVFFFASLFVLIVEALVKLVQVAM